MSKQFIISTFKDGQLQNRTGLVKLFRGLKDGKYEISVTHISKRSNQQNRFYFGLVVPMIQKGILDLGTEASKEEIHEMLKGRFNKSDIVNTETGEMIVLPKSTTSLSKEEFSSYIEKIQRWASEFLNIVIPDPGVQTVFSYD